MQDAIIGQSIADLAKYFLTCWQRKRRRVPTLEDNFRGNCAHAFANSVVENGKPWKDGPHGRHHHIQTVLLPKQQCFDGPSRCWSFKKLHDPARRQVFPDRSVMKPDGPVNRVIEDWSREKC